MSHTHGSFWRTTVILIAVVVEPFLVGHARASAGQQIPVSRTKQELRYKCDTRGVRLDGTLTERTFYGPPGLGETPAKDLRDKVLVLKLVTPITDEPTEDAEARGSTSLSTVRHVQQIQLFPNNAQTAEARTLIGKPVGIVTILEEAIAPSQYKDVTIDVEAIEP